jgi:hypothetical protein
MAAELIPSDENVKRAQRKFDHLKSVINGYVKSNPHRIRTEMDAGTTYVIGCIDQLPPEDVAWETVEIVQRLRIALDKAMVALVERNGHGTSGVGFPFGGMDGNTGQPNPFPDQRMTGKYGIEKKLTAAQWAVITAYKPYPGGNDALWAVNEVANEDKHRKNLVTTNAAFSQDRFMLNAADGTQSFVIRPNNVPIAYDKERETVFLSIRGGTGNFNVEHGFAINVVFGDIIPVSGKNVLVVLNQQIRMIEGILKGMRAFFK